MRALKAAVIVMGVLIVAGVAVLAVTLVQRIGQVVLRPPRRWWTNPPAPASPAPRWPANGWCCN